MVEQIILTTLAVLIFSIGGIILIVVNRRAARERVKKNPDNPAIQARGAAIAHDSGDPEEALELANKALKIDPRNLLANFVKAVTLHELKDFDGSEEVLHFLFEEGGLPGDDKRKIARNFKPGKIDLSAAHLHRATFMALCFYYYGHLLHMAEEVEESLKYKDEAYKIDSELDDYLEGQRFKFY